jgi:aspartate/methionine/tyrosine aminotransferase
MARCGKPPRRQASPREAGSREGRRISDEEGGGVLLAWGAMSAPCVPPAPGPRPRLAARIAGLRASLYARILARLESFQGELFPFHIGESHQLPDAAIREALGTVDDRAIHRYSHPQGLPPLREALAAHLRSTGMTHVEPSDVLVVHGATHGLSLACQAILDPGDEVLVLSPHWPLINGMIHTACAIPVEVPFTSGPGPQAAQGSVALLASRIGPKTRAVYLTSPNNPDGAVLGREELEGIARLCIEHDLYALVDEAYDRFLYADSPPRLAMLPGMAERTINVFSFSKSHRMAGLRVGYVVAPPAIREAMTKLANISIYNVPVLMQRAALAACGQEEAVRETVALARKGRELLCSALETVPGVRFQRPQGGAYVFVDLDGILGERDCAELLERCLDEGVVFSPGEAFGTGYERWARFCFTTMDADTLERGAHKLTSLLRQFSKR